MIKFLINIIPIPKWRRAARKKYYMQLYYHNNNSIVIVTPSGERILNPKVFPYGEIKFKNSDNYIEIHEPFPVNSLNINISGHTRITIGATTTRNASNMKLFIINWYDRENSLTIGRNFKCNGMTIFLGPEGSSISIGDDCMTSWNVQITASDHHPIVNANGKVINRCGNVHIGNHVWIGMNAILLKNIIIPDNCIIGAGAVVSGKFSESNCILAGNPAKIVRRGINWGHENILSGVYG